MDFQLSHESLREDLVSREELESQSEDLIYALVDGLEQDASYNFDNESYSRVKSLLEEISTLRDQRGFSHRETSFYVLTLKQAFYRVLKIEYNGNDVDFCEHAMKINTIIDEMCLLSFEIYLRSREKVIDRQSEEIEEISSPVIKVWDDILAIPLIGTIDSSRAQLITENLLTEIVETGSSIAILDISGVPAVDSLVAQHIIKTVTAARLMGAECIICGIKPEIAQTMVHLGVNLVDIVTKGSMASALSYALRLRKVNMEKARKI